MYKLANGLAVYYTARPNMPIVSARLVIRSGSDQNPLDRPGLAGFTAALLTEGTATRSALQVADEAAQLGTALTTSSSMDAMSASVTALTRNFPAALNLLSDVILHPAFPAEEVERQRKSRLASLTNQRANPSIVATNVMNAAIFGPKHPYGYSELGTRDSVEKINRDDMSAFWKKHALANNAALIVAGSIPLAELKPLVEKSFGGWKAGTLPVRRTAVPTPTTAKLIVVDMGASAQSQVRTAAIGAARSTPDFPRMQVLNEVVGGLFSSRINMNLREEHGYTYGAFSTFVYRKQPGPFFIGSGIRTDVTGPAVGEIMKELKKLVEKGITQPELELGRDSIVRSLPADFETSARAAGALSNIYLYDLGTQYYAQLPAALQTVNTESVLGAARKYLAPARMTLVVVGDRATIEPELRKLNIGPIEFRDAEGKKIDK
jgi:zinc protease